MSLPNKPAVIVQFTAEEAAAIVAALHQGSIVFGPGPTVPALKKIRAAIEDADAANMVDA